MKGIASITIENQLLESVIKHPQQMLNCTAVDKYCFTSLENTLIWEAIHKAYHLTSTIEPELIEAIFYESDNEIEKNAAVKIAELCYNFEVAQDVTAHAARLVDLSTRRKVADLANRLKKIAYDANQDITTIASSLGQELSDIIAQNEKDEIENADSVATDIARTIQENLGKYKAVTGLPSGFENYDLRTGGFSYDGDLAIIAGRPSMGKTSVALQMAVNSCYEFGRSGLFFSMEMNKRQITEKVISTRTGISEERLRRNNISDDELDKIYNEFFERNSKGKLYISSKSAPTIDYIASKAAYYKMKHSIEFIVVDYLQLIKATVGGSDESKINSISKGLKRISAQLKIPVIALSQLNRGVETRGGDQRPRLSDLRGAGAIEEDASLVTFIFRPVRAGIERVEMNGVEISSKGITELITAKHRYGECGTDYLMFDGDTTSFDMLNKTTMETKSVKEYNKNLLEFQDVNELSKDKQFFGDLKNETPFTDKMNQHLKNKALNGGSQDDPPF
jgi:replicative DNA helicase